MAELQHHTVNAVNTCSAVNTCTAETVVKWRRHTTCPTNGRPLQTLKERIKRSQTHHMVAISLVIVNAIAEKVPMMAIVLLMMSFLAFSMPALMSFTSCSNSRTIRSQSSMYMATAGQEARSLIHFSLFGRYTAALIRDVDTQHQHDRITMWLAGALHSLCSTGLLSCKRYRAHAVDNVLTSSCTSYSCAVPRAAKRNCMPSR